MDLLEHQAKRYLARYGVPQAGGALAGSVNAALAAAEELELGWPVVVKAQVPVGGRGKAGGVRLAAGPEELGQVARAILGMRIGSHTVRSVWLEPAADIVSEHYLGITFDRTERDHLVMVSARGGVDIESVAAGDPGAIVRLHVDPLGELSSGEARRLVELAGLVEGAREGAAETLLALYRCYVEGDATLVEVNPLVLTASGEVACLDAKISLDESAAFRHPEWLSLGEGPEPDPREALAQARGLNYIGLEGQVGIIANGAGLAMATLDVVHDAGGEAANFLDIGGGASAAVMAAALEVVNADPRVRSILVNIFGGITRGDEVARGILEALAQVRCGAPMVLRLDGTNAAEGRALLTGGDALTAAPGPEALQAGGVERKPRIRGFGSTPPSRSEPVLLAATMLEAARTAVALAGGAGGVALAGGAGGAGGR